VCATTLLTGCDGEEAEEETGGGGRRVVSTALGLEATGQQTGLVHHAEKL